MRLGIGTRFRNRVRFGFRHRVGHRNGVRFHVRRRLRRGDRNLRFRNGVRLSKDGNGGRLLRRRKQEASGHRVAGRVLVRDDEQHGILSPLRHGGSLRDIVLLRRVAREGPGPGVRVVCQGLEGVLHVFLLRHAEDHDFLGVDAPRVEHRPLRHVRRIDAQRITQIGLKVLVAGGQGISLQRGLGIPDGPGHLGGGPIGLGRSFLLLAAAGGQKAQERRNVKQEGHPQTVHGASSSMLLGVMSRSSACLALFQEEGSLMQ